MKKRSEDTTVKDVGGWQWSELWKAEDWWAIWLGFIILIAGIIIYFPCSGDVKTKLKDAETVWMQEAVKTDKFKTIGWYELSDAKDKVEARKIPVGAWLKSVTQKPHKWSVNPLDSIYMSDEKAEAIKQKAFIKYENARLEEEAAYGRAAEAEFKAQEHDFKDSSLNKEAKSAIEEWRNKKYIADSAKSKTKASGYNLIFSLIGLGVFFAVFFGIGAAVMGKPLGKFFKGFAFIYVIAVLAWILSYQKTMNSYGIGYAAWAILLGIIISNTVGTPKWVKPSAQTEYYIKTGLVLLGAGILFEKIITIGTAGIFVAWVVTPIVWVVTFWFGQKIVKMPSKRLNATICSDMSVCGVSAAIATAAACKAKKEELTLAVGLSLIFTAIMMVVMPILIKCFMPVDKQLIWGGAWIGGTVDATGAVAAAGAFLGEKALYVAATIKMIQNVLIGLIAFFVAVYFTTKVEVAESGGSKVGLIEIWYRFPKFVIGFIGASIIFSIIYSCFNAQVDGMGSAMIDNGAIKGMGDLFRSWFFSLAFVSIGLLTNFRELKEQFKGGKPLILYVCGQSFNLLLTLIVSYIMFYLVFPELTATI